MRVCLSSFMYPLRALSDFHRPWVEISLSETPWCAALEAPPDRRLCNPKLPPSFFTVSRFFLKLSRIVVYDTPVVLDAVCAFLVLCNRGMRNASEF